MFYENDYESRFNFWSVFSSLVWVGLIIDLYSILYIFVFGIWVLYELYNIYMLIWYIYFKSLIF